MQRCLLAWNLKTKDIKELQVYSSLFVFLSEQAQIEGTWPIPFTTFFSLWPILLYHTMDYGHPMKAKMKDI